MKKKIYTYREIREFAYQLRHKEIKETKEILMRQDEDGDSVAHFLASYSATTNWSTENSDILMLQNKHGNSVAHFLAYWHPTWSTNNLKVLSLGDKYGETVEDVMIERGKI